MTTVINDDSRALVNEQKTNAINKLQSACTRVTLDPQLMSSIKDDLNQGQVPPIFHAIIRLSDALAAAENGDVDVNELNAPCSEEVSAGKMPLESDNQVFNLKNAGINFHEAVDKDIPRFQLCEVGSVIWQYDEGVAAHACHLVNEKALMLGYGVESTLLTSNFKVDNSYFKHQAGNHQSSDRSEVNQELHDKESQGHQASVNHLICQGDHEQLHQIPFSQTTVPVESLRLQPVAVPQNETDQKSVDQATSLGKRKKLFRESAVEVKQYQKHQMSVDQSTSLGKRKIPDLESSATEKLKRMPEISFKRTSFQGKGKKIAHQSVCLLTRPESRGVIAECFQGDSTSAIIGSPGIGKSWTLLYALQQSLLYEEKIVLFFASKGNIAFLFYRRENTIYAWKKLHPSETPAGSEFFDKPGVLVLYDPPESKSGVGAKFSIGCCQLIVAMSANEKHDLETHDKASAGRTVNRFYLKMPSEHELQKMMPMMTTDSIDIILNERTPFVGRLPRYIINSEVFEQRKRKMAEALEFIQRLEFIQSEQQILSFLKMDMDDRGGGTVPGTLFTLSGTHRLCRRLRRDDDEDHLLENEFVTVPEEIDYDGKHVNFAKRSLQPVCGTVMPALANLQRESILRLWGRKDAEDMIKMGRLAEKLVLHDLSSQRPIILQRQQLGTKDLSTLEFNFSRIGRDWTGVETHLAFGDLHTIFASGNEVACFNKTFPVIDFAGPGKRVFQVTLSDSLTKKIDGVLNVLMSSGFITQVGENYIRTNLSGKLEWYWVVPPFNFKHWGSKKRTQFYITGTDAMKKLKTLLKKCWEECVDEYALEIPKEDPTQVEIVGGLSS
jgi:hypothetical protein